MQCGTQAGAMIRHVMGTLRNAVAEQFRVRAVTMRLMGTPRIHMDSVGLLVVDVQERLLPHICNHEQVVAQTGKLIDGFAALERPMLVTEQYRRGLGVTVPELQVRLARAECNIEKLQFSACVEPILKKIIDMNLRSVVLAGIEMHVCVMQTALDLLDRGLQVGLAVDACGSRRQNDADTAVMRMVQAGVLPMTVESCLLEMVKIAGSGQFKSVLPIIK